MAKAQYCIRIVFCANEGKENIYGMQKNMLWL